VYVFVATRIVWFYLEKYHILSVCVCTLSYPACNAHAHIVVSRLPSSTIHFLHSLLKAPFSRKVTVHKMCVWIHPETFV
jgi:hypothetical protein